MRSWWKILGLLGGMAWTMSFVQTSARAQFPPQPGGFGMPSGPVMGMPTSMGPPPTAFGGDPSMMGQPADFPNAALPSKDPVSPFSIKDEGLPNAFTELVDNRLPRSPSMVFRGEYLGWWVKRGPVAVPLVTTTNNFAGGEVGALNEPGTLALVPASTTTIDYKLLTGLRLSMGLALEWLPPIEVSGFSFTRNYVVFGGGSTTGTGQYLARPVTLLDVAGGLNTVEFVNVPGFAAGNIDIISRLSLWNLETNFFFNFADNGTIRWDFLMGYRHTDLYEALEINNRLTGTNATVNFGGATFPVGFTTEARDRFATRNAFDGGQIGFRGIFNCNALKFYTDIKLAMGANNQFLNIDGSSILYPNIAGQGARTLPGGVLALPSNMGHSSQAEFSLIPEVNLAVSYQLTQHIRLYGGYNFLYWTNVIRPGDHITNAIDSRQVPTDQNFTQGARGIGPAFPQFQTRDFFAHGFFVGVELGF